jgi:hypothetical protein
MFKVSEKWAPQESSDVFWESGANFNFRCIFYFREVFLYVLHDFHVILFEPLTHADHEQSNLTAVEPEVNYRWQPT